MALQKGVYQGSCQHDRTPGLLIVFTTGGYFCFSPIRGLWSLAHTSLTLKLDRNCVFA